ncbi:hypothetical protein ACOME3_006085 [Neoechinorhynchus agilis]
MKNEKTSKIRSSLEQTREDVAHLRYEKNMYEALVRADGIQKERFTQPIENGLLSDENKYLIGDKVIELSSEKDCCFHLRNISGEEQNIRNWEIVVATDDNTVAICKFSDQILKVDEDLHINLMDRKEKSMNPEYVDSCLKLQNASVLVLNGAGMIVSNAISSKSTK